MNFITTNHEDWLDFITDKLANTAHIMNNLVKSEIYRDEEVEKAFKGYILALTAQDDEHTYAVKTRMCDTIEELKSFDFSNDYLYSLEYRTTAVLDLPEEKDFDEALTEMALKFKTYPTKNVSAYVIRYASPEEK